MRNNQIAYHSYADDTQIYLALSPNDYSPIDSLCQCIDEINSWMCQNFLQLNKEKTEVIAFGNKYEVLKVNAYLDSRGQTTKNLVFKRGSVLDVRSPEWFCQPFCSLWMSRRVGMGVPMIRSAVRTILHSLLNSSDLVACIQWWQSRTFSAAPVAGWISSSGK